MRANYNPKLVSPFHGYTILFPLKEKNSTNKLVKSKGYLSRLSKRKRQKT